MVLNAILICSDPECADRLEEVGTLPELESWACECGCGRLILRWPDPPD
jgi:hypothetical protein